MGSYMNEDLERARSWIQTSDAIAVLTGAGISAESGVPTFRDADGLWRNFRLEELATPEAFERDPKLVWDWYNFRRERIAKAQPNPGHMALVELETRKPEFTLITQNVDGLHELAGSKNILKLHGDIWQVRCTKCGAAWVDRRPSLPEIPPHCLCGALARSGVVWFGEPLPKRVINEATQAVKSSEILLVIGTSAVVYPAAGLIPLAKAHGRTVIEINPDETPCSDMADCSLHGPAGEILPRLVGSDSHRPKESDARSGAQMKTFGEMSAPEIRTMAAWLRSKLQGRANPLVLSQLSDEELVMRYLRGNEERMSHGTRKEEER